MLTRIAWLAFLFILVLPGSVNADDDVVEKTYCTQAFGYETADELKAYLLLNAQRLAVNELFGELIASSTAVDNSVLTSDQIRASSLGLIRIQGIVDYYNGDNFAEVCASINAYTTEQDLKKFKPYKLTKRLCASDPDLTTRQIREVVKDEAAIQALLDYDRDLEEQGTDTLLRLLKRVNYTGSGFVPETETYCTRVEGYIVPIEILALIETTAISETASGNEENPDSGSNVDGPAFGGESDIAPTVIDVQSGQFTINERVPFFSTKFWLSEDIVPLSAGFLVLDVADIHYVNSVWINDILIGSLPGQFGDPEWQPDKRLFIPASILQSGENMLMIEAGRHGNNHDDHYGRNIRVELIQDSLPNDSNSSIIPIESEIHHIGDDHSAGWAVPATEGLAYSKFFELPNEPQIDAILRLKTFHVDCLDPLTLNERPLGYLPGTGRGDEHWTDAVQVYVPKAYLRQGVNKLTIEATRCSTGGSIDDFMIRDVNLLFQ